MIEKSITNSWKDVYPLKENKTYFRNEKAAPEWIDKNIDSEELDPIELQKLEKEMSIFE